MVLELANGGTLREHLGTRFKDLTWKDKYKLGLGIASGLQHLHELDIVHKDLVFIRCRLYYSKYTFLLNDLT